MVGGDDGRFFILERDSEKIYRLDVEIPERSTWTAGWVEGETIYGGTQSGMVFSLNLTQNKLTLIGKPFREGYVRCMAIAGDGKLYGCVGEEGGFMHFFCFDSTSGKLSDLGVPAIHRPISWHLHCCSSMLRGHQGELYLGEYDRKGHLWIYYPQLNNRK